MARADVRKGKINREGLVNAFRLYSYLKPYKWEYALGLFFLLGSSLANLAFPKLLGDLVNAGNEGTVAGEMARIGLFLIVLLLVQSVFSYFRTVLFFNVTEKSLADLRQQTYNHLIRLPIKYFEKHRVGELNSRISSDISMLQETLTSTLSQFISQIIIITGGITLLVLTSFRLTMFMLAVIPAIVLLSVLFGRYIRKLSKRVQKEIAVSNTIVEETLQGIQSVKAYTNEFFEMLRYRKKTNEIAEIGMRSGRYRGAFGAFIIFGIFGAMVTVIWKGALLLSEGAIDPGQLFSFVIYTGFIAGTIGGLANVFTSIQRFIGATEDLFEVFDEEHEDLAEIKGPVPQAELLKGKIEFRNLNFAYPSRPEEPVLKELSFTVLPDQLVALVGVSGAGKTTLTSLILRLYNVEPGHILFDDKDYTTFPLSSFRSQISLVPQDIFLFGGTIRENIAYGRPGAGDAEIELAASRANALEFIDRFPGGFETLVGERGTQLSGGQRQRIAIARAVLKNPRILILDEATSSLDSESEKLVQDALEKLMVGRTSIVIAHRLSTIRKADQIFVIDKGRLVERGTHKELLSLPDGVYKSLNDLQFGRV
ncbi:MAG: ABC transporter ATP-binding protein [Marinilabiliaceae bacterium]|jgi:ABC-type multidrug transport system fused ATPase/permease subunit|nr:ABC transporter ATP-binding protein [Marinilabiliaceae bacterium]